MNRVEPASTLDVQSVFTIRVFNSFNAPNYILAIEYRLDSLSVVCNVTRTT